MVEDPPYLVKARAKANPIDRMGLGLVAVGVGCLEFVLDKGQEKDWFGDRHITFMFIVAVVTLIIFCVVGMAAPGSDCRHQAAEESQFWHRGGPSICTRHGSFQHHGADTAISARPDGLHGGTSGHGAFRRCAGADGDDANRWKTGVDDGCAPDGCDWFLATSIGLYNMTRLDLDVSFGNIVLWRVFQVLGLSFIFIPISTLNYVGVPRQERPVPPLF